MKEILDLQIYENLPGFHGTVVEARIVDPSKGTREICGGLEVYSWDKQVTAWRPTLEAAIEEMEAYLTELFSQGYLDDGLAMSEDQVDHCGSIEREFSNLLWSKYRKGVQEHGGNLWQKDDILDNAIEEAVDLVVYLLTLKQQKQNEFANAQRV